MQGAVAQLGERGVRNAEVRGSIPLRSTSIIPNVVSNLLIALTVKKRDGHRKTCARSDLQDSCCIDHRGLALPGLLPDPVRPRCRANDCFETAEPDFLPCPHKHLRKYRVPCSIRRNMGETSKNASDRLDIHNSEVPLLCRSCEARHKGICGALNPAQLVELSKHTLKHSYEAEKHLASDSEKIERYSNILRGVVKLSKLTSDGRQQIVGLQFAPDFMGRPFSNVSDVEIESATDVKVCSFPRSVLEKLIKESPELEHRLHQQTLKELDEARNWMLTLGRKSAAEKVSSFLYYIAIHVDPENAGRHGPLQFEIPLSRSDIADFLGLTIETVSRHFTKLRHLGVINLVNNRRVEVPDLNRLHAMAEVDHG
jgi:CRP/FNR family transcriptional regulator, anaerobic regulatory protein